MTDKLNPVDWTNLIPKPSMHWDSDLSRVPVVKFVYPDGREVYGITTPIIRDPEDGQILVTSINYELSEAGTHSMLMTVPVEEIKTGELELHNGLKFKVEFAGLAGDPSHKDRKWSYLIKE